MEEKDRLTKKEPCWENEEFWISAEEPDESKIDEIYLKLRDYEDTNLSPQEVEQLKKENADLKSSQNKIAIEKLEKVKKYCLENQEELLDEDNLPVGNAIGTDTHIYLAEMSLYDFIDTMIAELKV